MTVLGARETFLKGVMDELGFQNKEEPSRTKELAGYFILREEFTKTWRRETPRCAPLDNVSSGEGVSGGGSSLLRWSTMNLVESVEETDFIV